MSKKYIALVCTVLILIGVLCSMVLFIDSGYKITQMRNAFIASPGVVGDFDWIPKDMPDEFLVDTGSAPTDFEEAVQNVLTVLPEDANTFDRALALARHLATGPGFGSGIKSNTRDAYRTILTEPRGYCSDYTQVLNGLAYAAEIPIREWGMSFDDYSGDGHGFSEVYDDTQGAWVLLDSFYSLYFVDAVSARPLSSLELRQRLAAGEGSKTLEVRAIDPSRFGFKDAEMALDYYRRGADGFFLYYGNNVFSYDENPAVAVLGRVSRALEESAGILLGIRPGIRLVVTGTNGPDIDALLFRRSVFLGLTAVATLLIIILGFQLLGLRRRRQLSRVS